MVRTTSALCPGIDTTRVDKDRRNGDRVHRGQWAGLSPDEILGPWAVIIGSTSAIVDLLFNDRLGNWKWAGKRLHSKLYG